MRGTESFAASELALRSRSLSLSLSLMMMMIVCFLATLFSFLRVVAAVVHIFVVRFKLIICLCIECRALILAILFHIARVCARVCVCESVMSMW